MEFKVSKELEKLNSKRDLMELNGMDTKNIDKEILSKGLREIFNCNDPEVLAEFEKADQRTYEASTRYDKIVGTNLHPLEEAKRACNYILDSLDVIIKSKDLATIDLHISYIGYAVVSIGSCVDKLTNRFENGYKSPYEKHGLKEIKQIKSVPPINKLRVLKKESKVMRDVIYSMRSALNFADKERLNVAVCDVYAQNGELEYYICLKDKKTLR